MILFFILSIGCSAHAKETILWDTWYTITIEPNVHFAVYHETVKEVDDKIQYFQKVLKKEEGYTNEESIGAYAMNTPELVPLFYNFRTLYRSTENKIDATIVDGKTLQYRIQKGVENLPMTKKPFPKKAFLSSFFPLWLRFHLSNLKLDQPVSFLTVVEDTVEQNLESGIVRKSHPDTIATSTKTSKLTVEYQNNRSSWWVFDTGEVYRIEMPALKRIVQKVSKDKALQFIEQK